MPLSAILLLVAADARSAHPADACNSTSTHCFANRQNLISTHEHVEIGACCDLCKNTSLCASFSHWGGEKTQGPANCFLFSTVNKPNPPNSHCTSGVSGRSPAPAPAPGPAPKPPPRPISGMNFIFYFPDGTRAESLGTYGHPITKTPSFDRLAAQGTLFKQAHTLHTQSAPSRCAMATGRYVHSKGHRTQQHLIQSWESDIFGMLHDQGYFVAFFGKNYLLSADSLQKVDHWVPEASADNDTAILDFLKNPPKDAKGNPQAFIILISTAGAGAPYVGSGGKSPSFGEPGYYSYYNNGGSIYDPKELQAKAPLRSIQPASSKKPDYHRKIRSYRQLDKAAADSDYFYKLNAVYLQAVTQNVDALLGKVLDALDADPALDNNTALIASSDAGDYAGDFGLVDRWAGGLDDVLTRVPFVARIPGGAKGHVVAEQIQVFDVFPTVLELADVNFLNTHFSRSLVPQLRGGRGDPQRVVYAEAGFLYPTELEPLHSGGLAMVGANDPRSLEYPRYQEEMEGCPKNVSLDTPNYKGCNGSPRAAMARTLTHKLVYRPEGVSEFYDLTADPKELSNLWGADSVKDVQAQMVSDLLQWYLETSDTTDWQLKTGRGAPKMPSPAPPLIPKGTRAPGDHRPNFVLYFPDTVRAESCGGVYGNPVVETPFLDGLAKEGVAFTQAHVLHTQCAPSRHAIVTGRYLHTTGHRTQAHGVEMWEPDIFKYLHDAGYYINWFGKDDALGPNAFKYIDYWEGQDENNMIEFLSQNIKEPFFTFIPTIGAHPAYKGSGDIGKGECFKDGDPGYWSFYNNCTGSIYDWRDVKAKAPLRPTISAGNASYPQYRRADGIVHYHDLGALNDDEVFFYRLNAIYLDMVHRVDTELGDLLAAIDNNTNAPGLKDRTAVFVSSDHGDFGGDHHLIEKWPGAMDDVLTRVPFVARIPGGAKGHVVTEQIQVFDVMPTVLELAGITPNRTHFARSLVPQLMGATGDPDRVVYSEGGFLYPTEIEPMEGSCDLKDDFYGHRGLEEIQNYTGGCSKDHWDDPNWTGCQGSPRAIMAKTLKYKLVYRPREVSEFYDLTADPKELNNLWGADSVKDVQVQMVSDLLQWYLETTDVTPIKLDDTGYPANQTKGRKQQDPFWWEVNNPNLHPELNVLCMDGSPLSSH